MERYTKRTFGLEVVMVLAGLVFCIPVYVMVNESFKSPQDLSGPLSLVTRPTLDNFRVAWENGGLGGALMISALVTTCSVVILVLTTSLASYPLARSTQAWSTVVFFVFMIGLLLPFQLALIPLYSTMRELGLLGNPLSLILFYSGREAAFSVFLYTMFLRAQPAEYEESAAVDGCGPFRTFWFIVFPLLRPVTGTVIILNVLGVWNDFFTPLLYLSGSAFTTTPVALYAFVGQWVSQWNVVFAGLVISTLPILVLYFLMQKTIIRGFASGLKG